MLKKEDRYKAVCKEILFLIRSCGRSNFILKSEVENIINKYNIKLHEVDVELDKDNNNHYGLNY